MNGKLPSLEEKFFMLSSWIPLLLRDETYKTNFHEAIEQLIDTGKKTTFFRPKKLLDHLIPIYNDFLRNFSLFIELPGDELFGLYFYLIRLSFKHVLKKRLPLDHEFFLLHDIHEIIFRGK